jgi:YVTN family beta-propeller protein
VEEETIMKGALVFSACLVLASAMPLVAEQGRVVIDDLTVREGGKVISLDRPVIAPPEEQRATTPASASAFGRDSEDGYAACSTSDDAYPFDLAGLTAGAPILLPGSLNYPYDATMRPDGSEVWVADASDNSVIVIDRGTDTVTHQVPVCEYAVSVAFSQDGSFALAICRNNTAGVDNMVRVSTSTYDVLGGIVGPLTYLGPGNVALDPVSGSFYMVQWYDNALHEVSADGTSLLRSADLGTSLWQLVVDPDGSLVYVTDRGTDQVRVIERATFTQVTAITVGDDPWGIDITPDGATLVVACEDSQNVVVVDTTTWATTLISVSPGDPRDVDISPDGSLAFVAGGDSGTQDVVYVIDVATATLSGTILLPAGASNVNVVSTTPQFELVLFADGFESGDTNAWTMTVP